MTSAGNCCSDKSQSYKFCLWREKGKKHCIYMTSKKVWKVCGVTENESQRATSDFVCNMSGLKQFAGSSMKSDKWKFFFLVIIQYNVTWNPDVLTSMSADSLRGSEYIWRWLHNTLWMRELQLCGSYLTIHHQGEITHSSTACANPSPIILIQTWFVENVSLLVEFHFSQRKQIFWHRLWLTWSEFDIKSN